MKQIFFFLYCGLRSLIAEWMAIYCLAVNLLMQRLCLIQVYDSNDMGESHCRPVLVSNNRPVFQ